MKKDTDLKDTQENTKETKTMTKEVKKLSKEEKKNLRRKAVENSGRLYLSDENKEEGYVYRVCNVLPGNIEKYKMFGGEVVTHNLTSGNGSLSTPEVDGSPKEFEVGGVGSGSMKAIWMRFTDEDYAIMKELEVEAAVTQNEMIEEAVDPETGKSMIPKSHLIGKITKG